MLRYSGKVIFSLASVLLSDSASCFAVENQQMTLFPSPSHHIIFVMPNTPQYIARSNSMKTACLREMQASQSSNSMQKCSLASAWSKTTWSL